MEQQHDPEKGTPTNKFIYGQDCLRSLCFCQTTTKPVTLAYGISKPKHATQIARRWKCFFGSFPSHVICRFYDTYSVQWFIPLLNISVKSHVLQLQMVCGVIWYVYIGAGFIFLF
ncbi:hypothetical protein HS088_TW18G01006 [Tripterygium wilfordii]|uniref:Uncharacterized protein n=1 Tax=Tripterygium wilfordii TaxID=458696 RepID=A0A7J7C497_TRIWF|nr:hypothetical protein HS088_TW21G00918 [Tripterygium wilfordii]KAF5732312.1 hypothetical protein HS088_TW18G01006 [Tripterygium wilfordii]